MEALFPARVRRRRNHSSNLLRFAGYEVANSQVIPLELRQIDTSSALTD